jgi:glycosyltransferase involved in cell wall biosynthesis
MDILWIIALPYKLMGKRFIFDHHDLCPELLLSRSEGNQKGILYKILLGIEKISFKVADVVIATNESYKDVAISRGKIDPDNVFVVRNGPDLDRFQPIPPIQDPRFEGKTLVGYLGNMNLQDGVDCLVEAARVIVLERGRSDLLFIFIGGGANQKTLAKSAVEAGLGNNVIFTGRLPEKEMLSTLCACDLCVQPDPLNPLNDKSTMNKAMEYMALKKPVVAFDLKETRVSCAGAALFASTQGITDLVDKILLLADDTELEKKLGQLGYERVRDVLAWSHSIPNLLAAYESALSTGRRPVFGEEWRKFVADGFSWLRSMPRLLGRYSYIFGKQSAGPVQSVGLGESSRLQLDRRNGDNVVQDRDVAVMILLHLKDVDIGENLDTLLRAAARLKGTKNLRILIVGEERALSEFQDIVSQLDIQNVEFHSSISITELQSLLAVGDVHVIFHGRSVKDVLIPQKTSDALAAGRPSLFVGPADCETAVILEDSRSGFVVTPGDVEGMEEGIRTLVRSPALREEMGRNARDYYEYYFRDDKEMSRISDILRKSRSYEKVSPGGYNNGDFTQ